MLKHKIAVLVSNFIDFKLVILLHLNLLDFYNELID